MFKQTIIFLFITQLLVYAQSTKVEVESNSFSVSLNKFIPAYSDTKQDNFTIRNFYEFTNPEKDPSFKLPEVNLFFAIPPNSRITINNVHFDSRFENKIIPAINPSATIEDSAIVYRQNDFSKLSKMNLENSPIQVMEYFHFRDFYIVHIKVNNYKFHPETSSLEILENINFKINLPVNPVVHSPIKIKSDFDKLLSNILANTDVAEQFRTPVSYSLTDTTDNWIDYNSSYLKIGVGQDGIYRINKSDLISFGMPVSVIDPRTLKLFESGKEVKINVKGEDDGVFDDNDYIEFWGKRNYPTKSYRTINNSNEEYNEYLNRYIDSTFYFLCWNSSNGERIDTIYNSLTSVGDTLDYYLQLQHNETQSTFQFCDNDEVANQTSSWLKNKSWFWNYLISQLNFNFSISDIYPNKKASIYFKLVSYASNIISNSHQVELFLNNSMIDSGSVDRFKQMLLKGDINSSVLLSGVNQIRLLNIANGSSPNSLITDWFDVEYPKYLKLVNNSLYFKIADDVLPGLKLIKTSNASLTSYHIYKINPECRIIKNYFINSSNLFFSDSVSPGDEYYIIGEGNNLVPEFYYLKNFKNLRNITQQADYMSITHTKFLNAVQNYTNSISNLYNLSTSVFDVQDIFDEFSFGYPYPESIRLFVNKFYNNALQPKPEYLTLIGDANYDYKNFLNGSAGKNYVPSFGNPVSDNWYAIWDPAAIQIPQLKVGRIPINESSELEFYLSKIQNNETQPYDDWNKRYLFFSGGRSDVAGELEYLKAPNDSIINLYVSPKPVAGNYTHFYKTRNPQTDFGPYSQDEISNSISNGGLFISYVGHSGTSTWDNSINTATQLENNVNRNPLITDFGCSTNKYAEPNIVCFGERFLFNPDGQALGYIGNSSLGFQSTAVTAPIYFYSEMFSDSLSEIGNASLFSKMELITHNGNSGVNRLYALTNLILGDPAIRLKIPKLPNFKISVSDILISNNEISENDDSIKAQVVIKNLGLANSGNVDISFQQEYESRIIKNELINISVPAYEDTITVWLVIKNKPGVHNLTVNIDPENKIQEIYENDNSVNYVFTVYSSSLRDLLTTQLCNSSLTGLKLLNPVNNQLNFNSVEFEISPNFNFSNPFLITVPVDTFLTKVDFPSLAENQRYYLRYKVNFANSHFSNIKSFYAKSGGKYLLCDSLSFNEIDKNSLKYSNGMLKISPDTIKISVLSAGYNAGATCIIAKDGVNLLSNTYFSGMGVVVFDNITLRVDTSTWFNLFNLPANVEALAALIDSIPQGKIVVMGVSDDASNNISTHLKNAIKSLGSSKIDSLQFRGSWAIIGWKGAPAGSVKEAVKPANSENVFLDTTYITLADSGSFITPFIGKASKWENISIKQTLPSGSNVEYLLFGKKSSGDIEYLRKIDFTNEVSDLTDINPEIYPEIKIGSNLYTSPVKESPQIIQLEVNFITLAELGTNYQVVNVFPDTIEQGKTNQLSFIVYNAGEVAADSFNIAVELIKQNGTSKHLLDTLIIKLDPTARIDLKLQYLSDFYDGFGNMKFRIKIDPDLKINEFYKDNNVFEKSFFVKEDTSITSVDESSVKITFDGVEILDGDFVKPDPEISVTLQYPIWFPVSDTTAIRFYFDDAEYFPSNVTNSFDTINRLAQYKLFPDLVNGEHIFKVTGRDKYGNVDASSFIERYFSVDNNLKLLDVYNYPNPFSDQTFFTFRLTQIPEELDIRIFTIAGRLIKNIKYTSSQLKIDFNKFIWDGNDEDGNPVASGIYLYKVIVKNNNGTFSTTQKLAVLR